MNSPVFWYATRATGIVALILLTATMVLGVMTTGRFSASSWPRFAQQDLHRRVTLVAVAFLVLHIVTSVVDTYVDIGWASVVVPFASHYKRTWVAIGTLSLDLMLAVMVTSILRHRVGARLWRAVHWLAYLSWPLAVVHTFGMGTDMGEGWALGLGIGCIVSVVTAVAWKLALAVGRHRDAAELRTLSYRTAASGDIPTNRLNGGPWHLSKPITSAFSEVGAPFTAATCRATFPSTERCPPPPRQTEGGHNVSSARSRHPD